MLTDHIVDQFRKPDMREDNTLHVIGIVSNAAGWHARLRLFRRWRYEMLHTKNVKLYVIEGIYGDFQGECAPEEGQEYEYMSVNLDDSEIWLKENLQNIAVKNMLPPNWKYLCLSDTDIHFRNHHWAHQAIKQLQTYEVIQPWSHGTALLADGAARLPTDPSFCHLSATDQKIEWGRNKNKLLDGYQYGHCGYCWCYTRFFWENVLQFIDFCVIGSGDHHMCWSLVGKAVDTIDTRVSDAYKQAVYDWQARAQRACGGLVGYVPGILEHGHHGPVIGRDYGGRWKPLVDIQFDPNRDLGYDDQGVLIFIGPNRNYMKKMMTAYNRKRREDSIEP